MTYKERESTNIPHIGVSELARALKTTLEDRFGYVRVRGEISGFRGLHTSGHAYFSLKDSTARIDAVVWRTVYSQMRVKPVEGLEVIASGKVTTYPGKSSYQIIVESLEPAGAGALMALLDARRRQLAAEGLFDLGRKRPLPFMPRVIGVVTSPTGSVIRDILHRLADRFPVHVVIWPVRVQGDGAAEEIAAAIRAMGAQDERSVVPRPQVLIVARGGGALEDLWSFNDEIVVRAVADCSIPLISAVGHETDWTLIDYAADVRAPTPSAAAEMCVPVRSDLISRLAQMDARRRGAIGRCSKQRFAELRSVSRGIPTMRNVSLQLAQRLDSTLATIKSAVQSRTRRSKVALSNSNARLTHQSPFRRLVVGIESTKTVGTTLILLHRSRSSRTRQRFQQTSTAFVGLARTRCLDCRDAIIRIDRISVERLAVARRVRTEIRSSVKSKSVSLRRYAMMLVADRTRRIDSLARMFESLNYHAILERGFSIVVDKKNRVIKRSEQARKAKLFKIKFLDGDLAATTVAEAPSVTRARRSGNESRQKELF